MCQTKALGILYLVNTCVLGLEKHTPTVMISSELKKLAHFCDPMWEENFYKQLNMFNDKYLEWCDTEEDITQKIQNVLDNTTMDAEDRLAAVKNLIAIQNKMNEDSNEQNQNSSMDVDLNQNDESQMNDDGDIYIDSDIPMHDLD